MIIGTTKELKNHEYRVGITPDNVKSFVKDGHTVLVETNAGKAAFELLGKVKSQITVEFPDFNGIGGFQPIAFAYIIFPILAGVFLRKGKWWGCFFGIAMGVLLIYNGMTAQPQIMVGFVAGLILTAYYIAMGLTCVASQKHK